MQAFNKKLALGAEYQAHLEQGLVLSTLTLGAQYKTNDFALGLTLSPSGALTVSSLLSAKLLLHYQ
jgi:hypothetical protein